MLNWNVTWGLEQLEELLSGQKRLFCYDMEDRRNNEYAVKSISLTEQEMITVQETIKVARETLQEKSWYGPSPKNDEEYLKAIDKLNRFVSTSITLHRRKNFLSFNDLCYSK